MPEEIPSIHVDVCPSCRGAVGQECALCDGAGVVRVERPRTSPCPVCSGSRIRGMVRPGGPGTIAATCRRCNGTGRILEREAPPITSANPPAGGICPRCDYRGIEPGGGACRLCGGRGIVEPADLPDAPSNITEPQFNQEYGAAYPEAEPDPAPTPGAQTARELLSGFMNHAEDIRGLGTMPRMTRRAAAVSAIQRGAVFSDDRMYRWRLTRIWEPDNRRRVLFIMLNPSVAGAEADDNTVRRCMAFAKLWGYGGCEVVNLFAFVATNPDELLSAVDPIGPECGDYLLDAADECESIVCGWGNIADVVLRGRAEAVTSMLRDIGKRLTCLGFNESGSPKHPLYLRRDAERVAYPRGVNNEAPPVRPAPPVRRRSTTRGRSVATPPAPAAEGGGDDEGDGGGVALAGGVWDADVITSGDAIRESAGAAHPIDYTRRTLGPDYQAFQRMMVETEPGGTIPEDGAERVATFPGQAGDMWGCRYYAGQGWAVISVIRPAEPTP